MRAFVTGGTGFLGSHIVDACLARGDAVKALVRVHSDTTYLGGLEGVELVVGDLEEEGAAALRAALGGVEVVYHCAARVLDYGSREEFYETNVHGTRRLLDAAEEAGVARFVFVSSPSIVMNGADQIDIDESTPLSKRFLNLYSETKAAAEGLVLKADSESFTTCAIRPRGVWGPRDLRGAMPKMIKRMKEGKLPNLSEGNNTLASICYCENAAHACMLAARSQKVGGKAYFVADAEPIEVWSFCDELADRFGVPRVNRHANPRLLWAIAGLIEWVWRVPLLSRRYAPPLSRYMLSLLSHSATYDLSAAERDFGYAPIVDRETGLKRIEAWLGEGGTERFIRYA